MNIVEYSTNETWDTPVHIVKFDNIIEFQKFGWIWFDCEHVKGMIGFRVIIPVADKVE